MTYEQLASLPVEDLAKLRDLALRLPETVNTTIGEIDAVLNPAPALWKGPELRMGDTVHVVSNPAGHEGFAGQIGIVVYVGDTSVVVETRLPGKNLEDSPPRNLFQFTSSDDILSLVQPARDVWYDVATTPPPDDMPILARFEQGSVQVVSIRQNVQVASSTACPNCGQVLLPWNVKQWRLLPN